MLIRSESNILNGLMKALTALIVMTTILCLYSAFMYFDSQNITNQQVHLMYLSDRTEMQVQNLNPGAARIHSYH